MVSEEVADGFGGVDVRCLSETAGARFGGVIYVQSGGRL